MPELKDFLRHSILDNLEVSSWDVWDEIAVLVNNRHIHCHNVCVGREQRLAFLGAGPPLASFHRRQFQRLSWRSS